MGDGASPMLALFLGTTSPPGLDPTCVSSVGVCEGEGEEVLDLTVEIAGGLLESLDPVEEVRLREDEGGLCTDPEADDVVDELEVRCCAWVDDDDLVIGRDVDALGLPALAEMRCLCRGLPGVDFFS